MRTEDRKIKIINLRKNPNQIPDFQQGVVMEDFESPCSIFYSFPNLINIICTIRDIKDETDITHVLTKNSIFTKIII